MNQMNVDTFPYRDPSDGTFVAHDYCDPDLSVLKALSDQDKRRVVKVHMDYLKVVSHLVQDFFDIPAVRGIQVQNDV
jgi:hypothetical protein